MVQSRRAIKLACLQTIPSSEYEIADRIREYLGTTGHKHAIFKGLGPFDLIVAYDALSFDEAVLTKAGPFPGILKFNSFLCYPCESRSSTSFFESLRTSLYCGFSFLKLDPDYLKTAPDADLVWLRQFQAANRFRKHLLGTLGWNDFILVVPDDRVDRIFGRLVRGCNQISSVMKSLSFLGMNLERIPISRPTHLSVDRFQRELEDSTPSLKTPIGESISVSIAITCEPTTEARSIAYWTPEFKVKHLLGSSDLRVECDGSQPLSRILATLIVFRHRFKGKGLIATNTSVALLEEGLECGGNPARRSAVRGFRRVDFSHNDLARIVGTPAADLLSYSFYSLNALIQNPLLSDVFADMLRYPYYVYETAKKLKRKNASTFKFITKSVAALRHGAENRYYGTLGSLEEVPSRFSSIRGGAQKAVLAAEYLPTYVMRKRLGGEWQGFLVAEGDFFYHSNEVINIPVSALIRPKMWWAIYHEIAHVFLYNRTDFDPETNNEMAVFLYRKNYEDQWRMFLKEICTETIGFELGFYGDYPLFEKHLWDYIRQTYSIIRDWAIPDFYILRTFFVKLFDGHFRDGSISAEQWNSEEYIRAHLLKHGRKIISLYGNDIGLTETDIYSIVANNIHTCRELYPVARMLDRKMRELGPLRRHRSELEARNTIDVIKSFNKGTPWHGEILFPEAIVYRILQRRSLGHDFVVALLRTFARLQRGMVSIN